MNILLLGGGAFSRLRLLLVGFALGLLLLFRGLGRRGVLRECRSHTRSHTEGRRGKEG